MFCFLLYRIILNTVYKLGSPMLNSQNVKELNNKREMHFEPVQRLFKRTRSEEEQNGWSELSVCLPYRV
jgi:hypothetical protein